MYYKMKNLLKSWQTTLVGFIILGFIVYNGFFAEEKISTSDLVTLIGILVGIGFLMSKDGNKTHSRDGLGGGGTIKNPPPECEECNKNPCEC